jgi:hypothetical protein
MPSAGTYYRSNKEMGYNGALRLRGEVFPVGHQLHDTKLEAIHYVERIDERSDFVHCADCGRDFESQGLYEGHLPRHAELLRDARPSAPPVRLEQALPGGMDFDTKSGRVAARR